MKNIILLVFIIFSMYSCDLAEDNTTESCGNTTNVAYSSFESCRSLKVNPSQPSFLVLNSQEEFQQLFIPCESSTFTLPDFTQKRVVGLLAGVKPTNGYAIKIQSVVEDNCQVIVEYFEKEPEKREDIAAILTYPSDYVVLPQSNKPVLFKKVEEITDYIIIGTRKYRCTDCTSYYRIDSTKTIRFLTENTTANGSYEALDTKEDFAGFVSLIPQEIIDLKGETKDFKNNLFADGEEYSFEYHQGNVVTKIKFINYYDTNQQSLMNFINLIMDKLTFLDASK